MALSQVLLATLNLTMTPSLTRGGAWLSGLAESSISPGQGDNWWIKFIQWLSQWLSGIVESPIWHDLDNWWIKLTQWLSEPHVLAAIMAWWITFTLIMTLIMVAGFGTAGIITGSLAAWFQSFMYGGFTPAGGIFATLTSLAMLGLLMPLGVVFAILIATAVSVCVGINQAGKV